MGGGRGCWFRYTVSCFRALSTGRQREIHANTKDTAMKRFVVVFENLAAAEVCLMTVAEGGEVRRGRK